jgi:hypothetical protein
VVGAALVDGVLLAGVLLAGVGTEDGTVGT